MNKNNKNRLEPLSFFLNHFPCQLSTDQTQVSDVWDRINFTSSLEIKAEIQKLWESKRNLTPIQAIKTLEFQQKRKNKVNGVPESKKPAINKEVAAILGYLEIQTGKELSRFDENVNSAILSHLKRGCKVDDFKKIVDLKIIEWGESENMVKYLTPKTLFVSKFSKYLSQIRQGPHKGTVKNKLELSLEAQTIFQNFLEFLKKDLKKEEPKVMEHDFWSLFAQIPDEIKKIIIREKEILEGFKGNDIVAKEKYVNFFMSNFAQEALAAFWNFVEKNYHVYRGQIYQTLLACQIEQSTQNQKIVSQNIIQKLRP